MTQLARETHNRLLSPSTPFQAVFEPDMSFFDFVIILKRKLNPHEPVECYSNVSALPKKYGPLLLCQEFIGELKVQTEEYILLFPSEDSLTIGGLWKTRKELVVSHLQDSASLTIKCGTLNKTAVLGLIMELGLGLVERIHIKISD
ncbi:hypothetical protein AOL_s00007g577 [Orbilia oligospora ATCC 24927]|uniref:Nrap protein domain-containing protein n=2 Tax=Orbilia oligospora TaxID=2813651 RepID=G1X2R7_ARTOA|nr:hypothetical protein AOL_s00007g577 [Orbilia oligospora ATCC 24927]EGX52589.1 hypothetical protein AOL_s00007g577 [Orbilia oligospora ATCC 24927]